MFKITDEMKKRCEENKDGLESRFLDKKRTYGVDFCNKFYRECKGNFDTRGWDDLCIMYVGDVQGMAVIIDGSIRRDTIEEFLDYIEELENKIINLNEKFEDREKAGY